MIARPLTLLLLGALVGAPALLLGQTHGSAATLDGRVTDSGGQPIALATVSISELSREVFTAPDGAFRFVHVPRGRYTLVVRRPGYAPIVRDLAVAGSGTVSITLTATPFDIEPLTVTATRAPIATAASPLPVATLGGEQVRRGQGVSLAQVLEGLPGLRTLSTGAQIGKPVIRGLSGARVLVLENGSRLEDYSWSDEDGPSVETGFVRRVEVIRGPASVLYGPDALGGVVNVISEQLPDAAGGPGFVRNGFTLSGASNNAELGAAARVEGARGRLGWRVAAGGRHAASLHTPAGQLDHTGVGAVDGEGSAVPRGGGGAVGESTAFDLLLQTTAVDLLAQHAAGERLRGTLGISGLAQWNDARGRIPLVPDARVTSAAAFASEQLALGKWSLLAGARPHRPRPVAGS